MLARSKLNSIKKMISQTLVDFEIKHEKCTTIINELEKYRGLKKGIRMASSQISDAEKNELIGEAKELGSIRLLGKIIETHRVNIHSVKIYATLMLLPQENLD